MTKRLRNHRIEYGAEFKLNAQKTYSDITEEKTKNPRERHGPQYCRY